ncbi:MAG: Crp/Fnr family transcriptional regulator [Ruminococcaceae bacterium]|nr:Crp/Fnr family transcriptional regulator [Oscillospiraceae bacterium]
MEKFFSVLQHCPLFEKIGADDLKLLLPCLGANIIAFDKKYTIFAEGSPAKYIGILLSGSAQIIQVDYYGNRSIVTEVVPSEMFGESFACADLEVYPVSVIANEPCEVMLIDCSRIMHACSCACGFHQQMIFNLMKNMAQKNIHFHQKVDILSRHSTREKLLAYLNLCAKRFSSNRFEIPFDRQELADYLKVDRSGLSAEIGKLRKEGVLQSNRKQFELL